MKDALDQLLQGNVPHPLTGRPISLPLQALLIEASFDGKHEDYLRPFVDNRRCLIIADPNTFAACGEVMEATIRKLGSATRHLLPRQPQPSDSTARQIAKHANAHDLCIAIGSGTINDLTKRAAHLAGKPYICIPTAASMNGYLSANASLIDDSGYRRSYVAAMPEAILIDLSVIAAAPIRLTRAGLCDSLCRSTVQADWLLSHHLLDTPYSQDFFDWPRHHESMLLDHLDLLMEGHLPLTQLLIEWLLISGISMTLAGSSAPASQGEHMLAHTMHMMLGDHAPHTLHGEEIGVTLLTMRMLQEELCQGDAPELHWLSPDEALLKDMFNPEMAKDCLETYALKGLNEQSLNRLNQTLHTQWSDLCHTIATQCQPYERLEAALERIATPTTPEALGWPNSAFEHALTMAPLTRDRLTFLDLFRLMAH